ncbi:glycosyltransferase family 2 protein [Winogradskyella bathintestinalis]|uniref:Glycosyltransferase n=1 Tax=Winogradskyella bathintestinalis TaxID=3035208 RepID=A0ABT7ZTT9_9FLAO|nr:glycosyltransferase [Winogradskyella bathintestinalis]MDN3492420.1 glycosyltransferase [Winogradskyella bathintestinalis]
MSLSIITPHYNDFEGLQRLYDCLINQTNSDWEWIIVDDFSDKTELVNIENWLSNTVDKRVRFIKNPQKTNASVCRNIGAEAANFENLVFLDADDYISKTFVHNRDIICNEFVVYKNRAVIDRNGTQEHRPSLNKNYLDSFLNAKFLWQTTAILWHKSFFNKIGKFDPNLHRLQDVELSIRALYASKNYEVIDNAIDFFYCTKPIRLKSDIVKKSCASVNYLILKLHSNYNLEAYRQSLLKSYYYACVKGLHRCKNSKDVVYVKESLNLFYNKRYINFYKYSIGNILLFCYKHHIISDDLFISANRYLFK